MEANKSGGMGFGRLLLYIAVISIGGIMLYNFYKNKVSDYTFIPTEMQITYMPADFKFDMDDENVMAVINNPHRYRAEFDELVYKFNMSLLSHVATRMDLPDSIKMLIEPEYQKHHPYLKQLYFNDFINIRDTTANDYEAWYENESASAVETLNEVASKYACFLVNHVIITLLKVDSSAPLGAKGNKINTPCGIAMTEGLRPLINRLKERAAIDDFSRSKGLLEERVEKVIAELATMEIRDKKGLSKQMATKIWGFNVSSTDIEISAISIMKIGFKIDRYFDLQLSSRNKTLTVTLPEPSILSHEVYPRIDKLDIGWLRELEDKDFNKNFNILRREFRKDAYDSDVMDKAKVQATEIMTMILGPVLTNFDSKYTLQVKFKNLSPQEEFPDSNVEKVNQPVLENVETGKLPF